MTTFVAQTPTNRSKRPAQVFRRWAIFSRDSWGEVVEVAYQPSVEEREGGREDAGEEDGRVSVRAGIVWDLGCRVGLGREDEFGVRVVVVVVVVAIEASQVVSLDKSSQGAAALWRFEGRGHAKHIEEKLLVSIVVWCLLGPTVVLRRASERGWDARIKGNRWIAFKSERLVSCRATSLECIDEWRAQL